MLRLYIALAAASLARGAHCAALLSCETPIPGAPTPPSNNDSVAVGTWYLLHCFTNLDNKCTERNCLKFDLVKPEERKQLAEVYASRLSEVKWEMVELKITTPCPVDVAGDKAVATPNYLEKQAPSSYKLITLPISAKAARAPRPRPVRLELVKGQYLVMLDCADLEPVVMVQRAPAPGYQDDPAVAGLLQFSDY